MIINVVQKTYEELFENWITVKMLNVVLRLYIYFIQNKSMLLAAQSVKRR